MNYEEYISLQVLCVLLGLLGLVEYCSGDNPKSKFVGLVWFIVWALIPLTKFWLFSMFKISI